MIKRRHSATYDNGASYFSFYGVRLWNIVNSPETAIEVRVSIFFAREAGF